MEMERWIKQRIRGQEDRAWDFQLWRKRRKEVRVATSIWPGV